MAKLSLKYGDVSIEYDGPETFLKEELQQIIAAVKDLGAIVPPSRIANGGATGSSGLPASSVSTIAQKLGVADGPALVIAAALSLAKSKTDAFTKRQLRDRMKEATTFYKASYGTNFDKNVKRLVARGRLNHLGGTQYAVPEAEFAKLPAT
jgi:hypothetical protein